MPSIKELLEQEYAKEMGATQSTPQKSMKDLLEEQYAKEYQTVEPQTTPVEQPQATQPLNNTQPLENANIDTLPTEERMNTVEEQGKDAIAKESLNKSNAEYEANKGVITNTVDEFEPVNIQGSEIKDVSLLDKAKHTYQSLKATKPLSAEFMGKGLEPLTDAPKDSDEYNKAIEQENEVGKKVLGDFDINKVKYSGGMPTELSLDKILEKYSKNNLPYKEDRDYLRNYLSRIESSRGEEVRTGAREKAREIITPEQQEYFLFDDIDKTLKTLENVKDSDSFELTKALKEGWKTAKIRGKIESEIAKLSDRDPQKAKELSDQAKALDTELAQLNPDRGKVLSFLRQTAEIMQPMASTMGESGALGMIPVVGQAIAPIYAYDKWRKMTAGQMFREMVDKGIDPQDASINASNLATVHALIESLEAGTIGGHGLKAIAKKNFIKKALSKNKAKIAETAKKLLGKSKNFAKDIAEQSIQEGVQAGIETSNLGKEFGGAKAVVKGTLESIPQMIMTVGLTGLLGGGARKLVDTQQKATKELNTISDWLVKNGYNQEEATNHAKNIITELKGGSFSTKTKNIINNVAEKFKEPAKEEGQQVEQGSVESVDIDKENIELPTDEELKVDKDIEETVNQFDPMTEWSKEDERDNKDEPTQEDAKEKEVKEVVKKAPTEEVESEPVVEKKETPKKVIPVKKGSVRDEMNKVIEHTKERARFTKMVKKDIPISSKMYKQLINPKNESGEVLSDKQEAILKEYEADYEKRTGVKKSYPDIIDEFVLNGLEKAKDIPAYKDKMVKKMLGTKIEKFKDNTKKTTPVKNIETVLKAFEKVDHFNLSELNRKEKALLKIENAPKALQSKIDKALSKINASKKNIQELAERGENPYLNILGDIKGDPVGLAEGKVQEAKQKLKRINQDGSIKKDFVNWLAGKNNTPWKAIDKGLISTGSNQFKVLKGGDIKDSKGNRVYLTKAQEKNLDKFTEDYNLENGTDYNGWGDLTQDIFNNDPNLEINQAEITKLKDDIIKYTQEAKDAATHLNYNNNQAMKWDEKHGSKNIPKTDYQEADVFQKKTTKDVKKVAPTKKLTPKAKPKTGTHIIVANDMEYNGKSYKLPDTADGAIYNHDGYSVIQIREGLSQNELVKTIKHELIGHKRLSNLLHTDKHLESQLKKLFKHFDTTQLEKDYAKQLKKLSPKEQQELLYNEWLAFSVQNHKTSLTQKVWSLIKRFFAKLGLREYKIKELLDKIETKTKAKDVKAIAPKVKEAGTVHRTVDKAFKNKWEVQYAQTKEQTEKKAKKLKEALKRVEYVRVNKMLKERNKTEISKKINEYMRDLTTLGELITPYQKQRVINYVINNVPINETALTKFKAKMIKRVDAIALKNYHNLKIENFRKALRKINKKKNIRPEARDKIRNIMSKYRIHTLSKAKVEEYATYISEGIEPQGLGLSLADMENEVSKIAIADLSEKALTDLQEVLEKVIDEEGLALELFNQKKMEAYLKERDQAISNIKKSAKIKQSQNQDAFNSDFDASRATKTSFLDYYWGTGKLRPEVITEIVDGLDVNDKNASISKVLFKDLVEGRNEYLAFKQGASDRLKKVASWNQLKNLTMASVEGESYSKQKKHFEDNAVTVKLSDGKVKLMPEDLISIYLHSLNNHNRKAILQEVEEEKDSKGNETYKGGIVFNNNLTMKPRSFSEADLGIITQRVKGNKLLLSLADHISTEMNTVNSEAIRKASSDVNFVPIKMVLDYFPVRRINMYKNMILKGLGVADMNTYSKNYVEQSGSLKERVESARGTLVINGAIKELVETTNLAASYSAFAERTRVARQLLDDIKKPMILAGRGKEYKRLYDYVKEVQGDIEGFVDEHNAFTRTIFSGLVKHALGVTPSVILRQVGSYPLILTEMDSQDVIAGLALAPLSEEAKKLSDTIKNYNPAIRARLEGSYANIELGKKAYNASVKDFLGAPQHWTDYQMQGITWADRATILRVVNAVKHEIERTTDLKGDAFWRRVSERSMEVIGRTQPMYSTEHRSAVARSKNPAVKMMTAFTSVTNAILNQTIRVIERYKRDGDKALFLKSIASIIFSSGILMSAIDMLIDMWKSRDISLKRSMLGIVKYLGGLAYGGSGASALVTDFVNAVDLTPDGIKFDADEFKGLREFSRTYTNMIGGEFQNFQRTFVRLFDTKKNIEDKDLAKIAKTMENLVDIPLAFKGIAFRNAVNNSKYLTSHFVKHKTPETSIDLKGYNPSVSAYTTINKVRYRIDKPTRRKIYEKMFVEAEKIAKTPYGKKADAKDIFARARRVVKAKELRDGGLLSKTNIKNNAHIDEK